MEGGAQQHTHAMQKGRRTMEKRTHFHQIYDYVSYYFDRKYMNVNGENP